VTIFDSHLAPVSPTLINLVLPGAFRPARRGWRPRFGPTSPAAQPGIQVPADRTYSTNTLPSVTTTNAAAIV